MVKELHGDVPPAKRPRQVTKDRRLPLLVETYSPDDTNLVEYLNILVNVIADE